MEPTYADIIFANPQFLILILIGLGKFLYDFYKEYKKAVNRKGLETLVAGILIFGFVFYLLMLVNSGSMGWTMFLEKGADFLHPNIIKVITTFFSILGYFVTRKLLAKELKNEKSVSTKEGYGVFDIFFSLICLLGGTAFYIGSVFALLLLGKLF